MMSRRPSGDPETRSHAGGGNGAVLLVDDRHALTSVLAHFGNLRGKGTDPMLERPSWLLQSQINPFPISGVLSLSDDGRLRFTLDAGAAGCMLGWLEKALNTQGLKERISGGERPVVFDLPVAQQKITWPKSLGGYGMKVDDGTRDWVITLDYPSGGGISQLTHIFKSKGTSKPWKDAFAAAGLK